MKIARLILTAAAAGALTSALAACGKDEPALPAQPAATAPAGAQPGGQSLLMGKGGVGADQAKPAPSAAPAEQAPPSVPGDDSTAEAAIQTWVSRLAAGDFRGAAEICSIDAPGHAKLIELSDRMTAMRADAGEDMAKMAMSLMTADFKTMTWEKKSETDTVVEYELVKGDKRIPVQVEKNDGVWRVVPPPGGLPT